MYFITYQLIFPVVTEHIHIASYAELARIIDAVLAVVLH